MIDQGMAVEVQLQPVGIEQVAQDQFRLRRSGLDSNLLQFFPGFGDKRIDIDLRH